MEMFTMDTDCRYCNCSGGDTNVKKIIIGGYEFILCQYCRAKLFSLLNSDFDEANPPIDTQDSQCPCGSGCVKCNPVLSEIARLDERCDMAFKQFNEASDIANTFYEKIAELQVWRRDVEVLIQGVAKSFANRLPF